MYVFGSQPQLLRDNLCDDSCLMCAKVNRAESQLDPAIGEDINRGSRAVGVRSTTIITAAVDARCNTETAIGFAIATLRGPTDRFAHGFQTCRKFR